MGDSKEDLPCEEFKRLHTRLHQALVGRKHERLDKSTLRTAGSMRRFVDPKKKKKKTEGEKKLDLSLRPSRARLVAAKKARRDMA